MSLSLSLYLFVIVINNSVNVKRLFWHCVAAPSRREWLFLSDAALRHIGFQSSLSWLVCWYARVCASVCVHVYVYVCLYMRVSICVCLCCNALRVVCAMEANAMCDGRLLSYTET